MMMKVQKGESYLKTYTPRNMNGIGCKFIYRYVRVCLVISMLNDPTSVERREMLKVEFVCRHDRVFFTRLTDSERTTGESERTLFYFISPAVKFFEELAPTTVYLYRDLHVERPDSFADLMVRRRKPNCGLSYEDNINE